MYGISLSRNDRWLLVLSAVLPPLATYLKFGKSRTLRLNCLFTACLFVPGIIHAIWSVCCYPGIVFRGNVAEEGSDMFDARDGSVIWELPRDHFRSISNSVRVHEAQSLTLKSEPIRAKSLAGSSLKSHATTTSTANGDLYVAHVHGSAPVLNPSYGWDAAAGTQHLPDPWALGLTRPLESIAIH
ncbi:hypothetical protein GQ54DRAFT_297373 [Martensiomyces pterosporus]|nr:hypothetical protein GQ54DRAFT_297373 [Martensiomyces pterosporus]